MQNFSNWLVESTGLDNKYDEYEGKEPHHVYHNEDGHLVHVHLKRNAKGTHAVHINKDLGYHTKITHWNHAGTQPSKYELERAGKEQQRESLDESYFTIGQGWLLEAKKEKEVKHVIDGKLTPNSAGKITEFATALHLHNRMHEDAGTLNTPAHQEAIKPFQDEIMTHSKGVKDPADVQLRIEHGKAAANVIYDDMKETHGPKARIVNVGHTHQAGDIAKFTRGQHNDTQQENPSDVAIEVADSKHPSENSDGTHFEGHSLKSTLKSKETTASNPAIHMNGLLGSDFGDKADKISREGLADLHNKMGDGHLSRADRSRKLEAERDQMKAAGTYDKRVGSPLEQRGRELGRPINNALGDHLHETAQKILESGAKGHKTIGKMLKAHLTSTSSMRWKKVKVRGDKIEKVSATVTDGSESELSRLLEHPKTRFGVSRSEGGASVRFHMIHPHTGQKIDLCDYTAKTGSNAYKSNTHNWIVKPCSTH